MKRFIALISVSMMLLGMFSGCTNTSSVDLSGNPSSKYYANSTGEFITYGYSSPTDGYWRLDEETYDDGEFRTQERYEEYLEAGLNTLMLQGNDPYSGELFEASQLKKNMDNALAAGIKRVIVFDSRIQILSASATPVVTNIAIVEDYTFTSYPNTGELNLQDTDALKEYLLYCMKDYKNHEAFFGVMLVDEPRWNVLPQGCMVYKALEEALPGIYVQLNLLPLDTSFRAGDRFVDPSNPEYTNYTVAQKYEQYIDDFCRMSGANRICMDSYPIKRSGTDNYYILESHLLNLRILNKVADKYGCTLNGVAQSTELARTLDRSDVALKAPNKTEMYWQINAYLGFGINTFSYYTYWAKQENSSDSNHTDGTAYMTHDGQKTELWYAMKDIHAEMQKFAPVFLNFKYQGCNYYYEKPTDYSTSFLTYMGDGVVFVDMNSFAKIKEVTVPVGDMALVTEHKDEVNNQYMYMIMNPQAPSNNLYTDVSLTATIDFGKEFKAVEIWYKGEMMLKPLKNGKLDISLAAGYAVYCLPY